MIRNQNMNLITQISQNQISQITPRTNSSSHHPSSVSSSARFTRTTTMDNTKLYYLTCITDDGSISRLLYRNQEANLLKVVAYNPAHCLFPLLPPIQSMPYNLRPRGHNFTLPSKDCRNFIS